MIKPKPISDIKQVKKTIEELQAIDIEKETIENLQNYFNQIMHGYSVIAMALNPGFVLYRGIKYTERPKKIVEIIYPPKNKAKINRASNEGEQMFYASASKKPVFYELNAQPGDKFIISTWKTNNVLLFNNIGYTKSNFEELGASRLPLDFLKPNDDVTNKFIADFLAKCFCQNISRENTYLYKLTIAIARIHLQNVYDKRFAGLFYPTVQLNADEENFAINKSVIDNGLLDFERIEFVEVIDKIQNQFKYRILDIAYEIKNGNIEWKNLETQWTLYDDSEELFFVEENERVIAYDRDGNIIDCD